MRLKWQLMVASAKMLFRQKEAIVWSLLLPLFMIGLFGLVNFDGIGKINLTVINEAGERGDLLVDLLRPVTALELHQGSKEEELNRLKRGDRDMVLVLPAGFRQTPHDTAHAFYNDERPREAQLAGLIVQRALDDIALGPAGVQGRVVVRTEAVTSRNLSYIDFLIPGIISMAIMQMGIFGVAFSFVSLKKRGILRRLSVTPLNPNDFVIAQVATRLVLVMLQISIMVGVGVLVFDLHLLGSLWELFIVGMLGSIVFLAIGFALAGVSSSEDQVAPMANVISLPMILLCGVFFSRSNLPGFVHVITDFFPLTYLADGMRSIAIDGASLIQIVPQLFGLLVWAIVSCAAAIKLFRWE